MTIDELMRDKAPGSVRLTPENWGIKNSSNFWFMPFYKDKNDWWHGLDSYGSSEQISGTSEAGLYTEPKPKKRALLYRYLRYSQTSGWFLTCYCEKDPEGFRMEDHSVSVEVPNDES